jgi:hypothetical protein
MRDGRSVVRLPFEFGQAVYHRIAKEREPGLVTGFIVRSCADPIVMVTWVDRAESIHYPFELTTEYVPDFGVE